MAMADASKPTPTPGPFWQFPFVDVKTGLLTDLAREFLTKLWSRGNAGNRIIPCNAVGTNAITLTPCDAAPLIEKYEDHDVFAFVAADNSGSPVTISVAAASGALPGLKAYVDDGAAQATAGDIIRDSLYLAIFSDHLDVGAGGFVLK